MHTTPWSEGFWYSFWRRRPPSSNETATSSRGKPGLVVFLVWSLLVAAGSGALSLYEFDGRTPTASARHWPDNAVLSLDTARPSLVFFMHPRCPCTAAGIAELDRALSQYSNKFKTSIIISVPPGAAPNWETGSNLNAARRLPGATLVIDRGGALTRQFGATDSGTLMVFNRNGSRLFSGGLTASRGHEGESTGSEAVRAIASGRAPDETGSPVFGCPLLGESSAEDSTG